MTPSYYEQDGITLYHGEALAVLEGLADGIAGAVVTDPPYSSGGAFRGDRMQRTGQKYIQSGTIRTRPDFSGDNRDQRAFGYWCALWLGEARRIAVPGAMVVQFCDWRQLPTTTDAIQAAGWCWRGIAAWDKTDAARGVPGRLRNQCEFIVWGSDGPMDTAGLPPVTGFFRRRVVAAEKLHQTAKPVSVMRWIVDAAGSGLVLDPFAGSGTTLVAARELGRPAIGIELDEALCEIAADRMRQGLLFRERA